MKLHWGNALLLFFIVYVGGLIFVVFKSTTIDHTLVVDNYYEHDIKYQEKYDKISNRKLLDKDLMIKYNPADALINFDFSGTEMVQSAKVEMYRASNKFSDFQQPLHVNTEKSSTLQVDNLNPGKWKVKVEWSDADRSYYKEQDIYIAKV